MYKNNKRRSATLNYILQCYITLLMTGFLVIVSTSKLFAVVEIDTGQLCPNLGNSDPNRELSFSLTTGSVPRDDTVSWTIVAQDPGSGTSFLNGDNIGP